MDLATRSDETPSKLLPLPLKTIPQRPTFSVVVNGKTLRMTHSSKSASLRILDINGKEFYSQPSISPTENISVQNFRPGIYLVDIPRFGIKKIIVR